MRLFQRVVVFAFLYTQLSPLSVRGASRFHPPAFRNGWWQAQLHRKDGHDIVFNFEVKDSAGKKVLYIRNAGERLLVDDITIEGDSILIRLPFFESQLRAVLTDKGDLEGVWLKRGADTYQSVPFSAFYGVRKRFATSRRPGGPAISGRWQAVFRSAGGKDSSLRVGEFEETGGVVKGTFLDPTGDLRFLEGVMDGDSLRLSCFDGGHAFLFTARVEGGAITGGQLFSGAAGYETWTANRDEAAALPDEFTLTKIRAGAGPLDFSFRDIDGHTVSIRDARFRGKVVLIQIMGSWCPNCMDETGFLSTFYDQYHDKGMEIIGLAYERTTDFARSQNSLRSFQQRFHVKYPMLITGVTVGDPLRAEKTLPQLEAIVGFPTTLFVGKTGNIEKVHTGFSGPGTGVHYEETKQEFYKIVDGLLGN